MSIHPPHKKAFFPGLITREKEPVNYEFAFPTLDDRITPNDSFYIRNHFPVPEINIEDWQLSIEGNFQNSYKISYNELIKLPSKTVMATLECAGNGRSKLIPKAKGLLWEQGAIGNAEWTGVSLKILLEQAQLGAGTIEIILEGADKGFVTEEPKSPGKISFNHSIPLSKAMQDDVLVAYKMNGEMLTPMHGYPVRAIIPGWYGMASVKWLSKIIATEKPLKSYWQTLEYAYWEKIENIPTLVPVSDMQVKSEIARPGLHEVIKAGSRYNVFGAAWAGENEIEKVEISSDGGVTWKDARLLDKHINYSWRLWEFIWQVSKKPGSYSLVARATDNKGNQQPLEHSDNRRTYMVNCIVPMDVIVQ